MDGIPSRMAHFVVDRLKCKRMEIICRGRCLKITPRLIHRLLGLPIGGVKIESIVPLEVLDDSVCQWRRQYEGKLLETRQIVEKIESAEDENTFDFRMDFLVLFIVVLVECHKNGRVRESILRYITSETYFLKIDWCDYIFESLKSCKIGWSRDENSSPFNGPLTILTDLTYLIARDKDNEDIQTVIACYEDNQDIQIVVACYERLLEKKPNWVKEMDDIGNAYRDVVSILKGLDLQQEQNLNDCDDDGDGPSWSLGISQTFVPSPVRVDLEKGGIHLFLYNWCVIVTSGPVYHQYCPLCPLEAHGFAFGCPGENFSGRSPIPGLLQPEHN
ncbi:hypothetical protein R6Q57_011535 [Mikania cordata]